MVKVEVIRKRLNKLDGYLKILGMRMVLGIEMTAHIRDLLKI